jgi:WD40 repeat protein
MGDVGRVDLTSGKGVGQGVTPSRTPPNCLAVSPDGTHVLSAGADPIVRYLDLVEGKELNRFGGHTDAVLAVAFTRDGKHALSAGKDRSLRRWKLADRGKEVQELELERGLPASVTSMSFSPDGTLLACTGINDHEGIVLLWDTQTGRLRARWPMPGPVQRLTFADDSTHLASANANGLVYIYRLERK